MSKVRLNLQEIFKPKMSILEKIVSVCLVSTVVAFTMGERAAISVGANASMDSNQTSSLGQEKTLGLCETNGLAVRIYDKDNQLLMRGFNRKLSHIWMNHTPIVLSVAEQSIEYINRLGELNTVVNIDQQTKQCSIQVEGRQIERGKVLLDSQDRAVLGNVTYRARIGLPPGSVIKTQLLDLNHSPTNTPKTIAESITITSGQQVPVPFALFYRSSEIEKSYRYGLSSQIFVNNELRWHNTIDYPVITHGAPNAVSVVVGMAQPDDRTLPKKEVKQPLPEKIVTAVQAALKADIGYRPVQVGRYSRETWSDGCLGLGGLAESCLAALTEGWQVELIDSTHGQSYVYRSNLNGTHVRRSNPNSR